VETHLPTLPADGLWKYHKLDCAIKPTLAWKSHGAPAGLCVPDPFEKPSLARGGNESGGAQVCAFNISSISTGFMSGPIAHFCQRWMITTLGVLLAAYVVPGIEFQNWTSLLVASLLLGFLNAFIRPILVLLSLPFLLVTFGLFYFVINAGLLWLVGQLVKGFHVVGFWPALGGGLVISLVGFIVNLLVGKRTQRVPEKKPSAGKDGPVIDI
jgi:putative membrane protein